MAKLADRFVLEREIGSGGMARVFLGRDEVLGRPVAVKLLSPGSSQDIAARFRREGRTAAKLSHPNIVQVYDAGEDDFEGRPTSYIVMEYVPGGDLKDLIDGESRLDDERLARLGAGVCAGLAHAHEKGVVHRDVKPHNILLDAGARPKLTDFGIARALDSTHATRTGSFLGTALYSSPEQLQGQTVTPKSDVYSFGATMYQAATGEPPFTGSPITVAHQHVSQQPKPPRELNGALSPRMDDLIMSCLAKDPEARPTADGARSRLEAIGEAAPATQPAPPPPEPTQPTRPASTADAAPDAAQTRHASAVAAPARRRGGNLFLGALALLALLAVAGIFALPSLLNQQTGNQSNPPANGGGSQQSNSGNSGSSGSNSGSNSGSGGGQDQQDQRQPPDQTTPPEETNPPEQTTPPEETQPEREENALSQEAAAETVEDVYAAAASGDYGGSYALLSQNFRATQAPTEGQWSSQFETLESISWEEGPNATVSGDTATVTGVTIAEHTDRTERNTGTWTLVNEGGEWRLSDISLQDQQIIG